MFPCIKFHNVAGSEMKVRVYRERVERQRENAKSERKNYAVVEPLKCSFTICTFLPIESSQMKQQVLLHLNFSVPDMSEAAWIS